MFNIPIGRVKERKPLGHCGHLKLQLVVGSILIENGSPTKTGLFNSLEQ